MSVSSDDSQKVASSWVTNPRAPAPGHRKKSGAACRTRPFVENGVCALGHALVREEGDQREQAQKDRRGSPDGQLRPMPLCPEAQTSTHLLEGDFHPPASYEPGGYLFRNGIKLVARQNLGLELSLRIAYQYPTQSHSGQVR